ncbi:hypothetical protein CWC20_19290 [Pseudoalteromonas aurantia]|uniref:Uncharacterized protein n=1 Tax=Pseudoalteromonas aurantia TaxID=43654 RepID=A0ABY2VSV5_9GAMM|nr:hypothetical protein CWC20_19290 [Pseudoalteromonas aurantia]
MGLYAALFIGGLKRAINARLRWFGFNSDVGGALRRAFYWGFKANDKRSPTVRFLRFKRAINDRLPYACSFGGYRVYCAT